MDQAEFWKLVASARSGCQDDQAFGRRMAAVLRELDSDALVDYERQLTRLHVESYSLRLWGAAHLMMTGGCYEDDFERFRAWLIAQGQHVFERAIADPDSLAELGTPEGELEEFLRLAPRIYRAREGREMKLPSAPLPALGEPWDFEDPAEMDRRYPRLFARFGDSFTQRSPEWPECPEVEEEWVQAPAV